MGPEHSGQTRMVLGSNGLGAWYRVGASWGAGGAMRTSRSRAVRVAEPEDTPKIGEVKRTWERSGVLRIPILGMILPNMGITETANASLAEALFSTVQLRVLGLLFGQPERSYQGAELIRMARSGDGAVHRVLTRLAESGLVTVTRIGNQRHYQANRASPVFEELCGLIIKTVGMAGPLQAALAPFGERIRAAFVYGSVARGTDTARSDVDLMIVGEDLDHADLYAALPAAEAALGRPVNPTIYTLKEFHKRKRAENPFLTRVLAQPRLWVIGGEHALA